MTAGAVARRALTALVLGMVAAALVPAAASALTCAPPRGDLAELHISDTAFVGQVVEQREETRLILVLEAFKGVAAGDTVEVAYADWSIPRLPGMAGPVVGPVAPGPPIPVVANVRDGRLAEGLCRFVSVEGLRAAAAAAAQGRTCTGDPPQIVSAVAQIRGRELSLRVIVAHGRERAHTVRVFWGAQRGIEAFVQESKRVPRSRTVVLRHRYPRTGRVALRVAVEPAPPFLCGRSSEGRDLTVRLRPQRS